MLLHERLLVLRRRMNLTQAEAALACGVPEHTYSKWEQGRTSIPASALPSIASGLKVSITDLLPAEEPAA